MYPYIHMYHYVSINSKWAICSVANCWFTGGLTVTEDPPHRHQHLQGFHCEEALGRQHGHPALVGIVDAGLGGKEDGKTMANPKKS